MGKLRFRERGGDLPKVTQLVSEVQAQTRPMLKPQRVSHSLPWAVTLLKRCLRDTALCPSASWAVPSQSPLSGAPDLPPAVASPVLSPLTSLLFFHIQSLVSSSCLTTGNTTYTLMASSLGCLANMPQTELGYSGPPP